jgi:hypothetical protein
MNDNSLTDERTLVDDEESSSCCSLVTWAASMIVGGKWALTAWPGSSAREQALALTS